MSNPTESSPFVPGLKRAELRFRQSEFAAPISFVAALVLTTRKLTVPSYEYYENTSTWEMHLWDRLKELRISPVNAVMIFELVFPHWYLGLRKYSQSLMPDPSTKTDGATGPLPIQFLTGRDGATLENYQALRKLEHEIRNFMPPAAR